MMRVRKFGESGPWLEVEHTPVKQCGFCEVARGNLKAVGDVIFFETAEGHVQRTECIGLASDGSPAFECWESDREEAEREISWSHKHCDQRAGELLTFELEPLGELQKPFFDALLASGMRKTECTGCGCELYTRADDDMCPPCREAGRP